MHVFLGMGGPLIVSETDTPEGRLAFDRIDRILTGGFPLCQPTDRAVQ
jgi:hypothetical protein